MARLRFAPLFGLLLLAVGVLQAQNSNTSLSPAGNWKLTLPTFQAAEGKPLLLIKVSAGKGKWVGEIVGSALLAKTELENFNISTTRMRFTIKSKNLVLTCTIPVPKSTRATKLYGEASDRKSVLPLELERTSLTSLDEFDQYRERLANEPDGYSALLFAKILLSKAAKNKVELKEARTWADRAVKSAELYGKNITRETLLEITEMLGQQKGFEKLALVYGRMAERDLDEKSDTPQAIKRVWDAVLGVLERGGNKDDAKLYQTKIDKLDFRVRPLKYAGRKAKSDRVVLAELFTGAQARSCMAASMAAEALMKTFNTKEVSIISYQQHFPEGDPLGSPDSEERLTYYGRNVPSLPVLLLNGNVAVPGGGGREDAQESYDRYIEEIEPLLETQPKAQLSLRATRKADRINISVEGSDLKATGEKVRLRVVLVESETVYRGESGRTIHLNVARAMPGGSDGTELKEKSFTKTFTVDLDELRKSLLKYQEAVNKKKPFPTKDRPLDLKNFRVIAFIQNDANLEVMQAAQVDVRGQ
jgi:hypothetical protein